MNSFDNLAEDRVPVLRQDAQFDGTDHAEFRQLFQVIRTASVVFRFLNKKELRKNVVAAAER